MVVTSPQSQTWIFFFGFVFFPYDPDFVCSTLALLLSRQNITARLDNRYLHLLRVARQWGCGGRGGANKQTNKQTTTTTKTRMIKQSRSLPEPIPVFPVLSPPPHPEKRWSSSALFTRRCAVCVPNSPPPPPTPQRRRLPKSSSRPPSVMTDDKLLRGGRHSCRQAESLT